MESALWTTWQKTARRRPDQIAVIDAATGSEWTALNLTNQVLAWLPRLTEFRTGQRIAFQMPNSAGWFAFFLALQARGLAALPLDGGLPIEGCRDLAQRLKTRALFMGEKRHEIGRTASVTRAACLKITSGSTAEPKAIACRAAHLLADGRNIIATMGVRAVDRNLAAIPLGHSYGLGNLVMPLILQGTAVVCAAEYLPRQLVEWITRHQVTVFPGVPALFRVLAALPPGVRLSPLRTVISAGAVLPSETAQAFHARFGLKIHNFYGSSETGGIAYDRIGSASLKGRSVGRPLHGVRIDVRGGRITVASAAVATPTGKWRLTDHGEWNGRGELVLLGRRGQDANIGGKKVHPLEIERVLRSIPGVTDAHVWLEHRAGRDLLVAAAETTHPRARVEHALAEKLPAWKIPRRLVVAPDLPRNARGKLDIARLKQAR